MLLLALLVQQLLMVGAPILLVVALRRRWKAPWVLFALGALAWMGSQAVHMPLNAGLAALAQVEWIGKAIEGQELLISAVGLGLTAGLCEEAARWLLLRYAVEGRDWRTAIVFGAGHGGFEAMWLGLLVLSTVVHMAAVTRIDADTLALSPALTALGQQAEAFWALPAWQPLLGGAERIMAIVCHLALTALVMVGVVRGSWRWLALAIAIHAALDAVGVWLLGTYPGRPWLAELAALGFTGVSLVILLLAYRSLRVPDAAS